MLCALCGAQLEAGSRFCGNCGAPVVGPPTVPPADSPAGAVPTVGTIGGSRPQAPASPPAPLPPPRLLSPPPAPPGAAWTNPGVPPPPPPGHVATQGNRPPPATAGLITSVPGMPPRSQDGVVAPPPRPLIASAPDIPLTAPSPLAYPQLELDTGEVISLDRPIVLGRDPVAGPGERAVPLPDPTRSVSKLHMRIEFLDGSVMVTDLHSTNGVVVVAGGASTVCVPGTPAAAPVGSVVTFGDRELRVRH